jgi:hypothetical protein
MEMIRKLWESIKAAFGPVPDEDIPGLSQKKTKIVKHTPRKLTKKKPITE